MPRRIAGRGFQFGDIHLEGRIQSRHPRLNAGHALALLFTQHLFPLFPAQTHAIPSSPRYCSISRVERRKLSIAVPA